MGLNTRETGELQKEKMLFLQAAHYPFARYDLGEKGRKWRQKGEEDVAFCAKAIKLVKRVCDNCVKRAVGKRLTFSLCYAKILPNPKKNERGSDYDLHGNAI